MNCYVFKDSDINLETINIAKEVVITDATEHIIFNKDRNDFFRHKINH